MSIRVLLVEDDHIQRMNIKQVLEDELGAEVETRSTESEFERDYEVVATAPPDIAVIDVMLRWANPAREMPHAPGEVTHSPQEAGLRCARRLRADPRTRGVRVILYSVLPKDNFGPSGMPEGATSVVKEPGWENLIESIRSLCQGSC